MYSLLLWVKSIKVSFYSFLSFFPVLLKVLGIYMKASGEFSALVVTVNENRDNGCRRSWIYYRLSLVIFKSTFVFSPLKPLVSLEMLLSATSLLVDKEREKKCPRKSGVVQARKAVLTARTRTAIIVHRWPQAFEECRNIVKDFI